MGSYDHSRFKVITIAIDVYRTLSSLRQNALESFSDVIRRLLKAATTRDTSFSFVRPVSEDTKQFYRSGLFG